MKLLSLLIPSTHDRDRMLYELLDHLHFQIEEENVNDKVEIITDIDNYEISVGLKRQRLIEKAKGEYVAFIDSDDWVANDYIEEIFLAIKSKPDVINFNGYMTTNGTNRENFKIAKDLPYITIQDSNGSASYLRHSNHLSIIKREIALQIGYKNLRFSEDYDYSLRLKNSGLLKTEIVMPGDLYHYRYKKK